LAKVKINDSGVVRFVCSELLISRKNLPVVLNALSKVESNNWSLDVLGDGPLLEKWKKLAISIKINDHIKWHGQLSKDAAIDVMSCCDVLLFPSLFEGAPGVVSEALSLGLPVVSMNKDGQHDILNENCGILIPVVNPHEAVLNFTKAVSKLLNDPVELERLSNGALKQACKFTIDAQMKIILDAYNKATSS
jgi:glycosyltransferase involved in cell wall biosynthesis